MNDDNEAKRRRLLGKGKDDENDKEEEFIAQAGGSDGTEDDQDDTHSEDEDEEEKQEQMRLAHTHFMLQQELERACETLGVVEDSAATNQETLDLYSKYDASLGTSKGLVRKIANNRTARKITLLCCSIYFCICVLWVLFCRFPLFSWLNALQQ